MNYFMEKNKEIKENTEGIKNFLDFVRECEPEAKLEYPERIFQVKTRTDIDE